MHEVVLTDEEEETSEQKRIDSDTITEKLTCREVRAAFKGKDLLAFRGICQRPGSQQLLLDRDADSAKNAWEILVEHHEQKGLAHLILLQRKFLNSYMFEDSDVMPYVKAPKKNKINLIWIGSTLLNCKTVREL
ncbi:hypothetical protein K7432_017221, partial [Basidiobolus ranarum]